MYGVVKEDFGLVAVFLCTIELERFFAAGRYGMKGFFTDYLAPTEVVDWLVTMFFLILS